MKVDMPLNKETKPNRLFISLSPLFSLVEGSKVIACAFLSDNRGDVTLYQDRNDE